ncbi:MAG TPA: hypothetical protein DCS93_42175 [Microscillaceae bacterium]|nr:hypothetical protein [Microscillaceae bacterium]
MKLHKIFIKLSMIIGLLLVLYTNGFSFYKTDPVIVLPKNLDRIKLTPDQFLWLEDQSNQLSFKEVLKEANQQRFGQIPTLNLGFNSSTHWVKVRLKSSMLKEREVVLELSNLTQQVTFFYQPKGKNADWVTTNTGLLNSEFKNRDIQRPYSAIILNISGNDPPMDIYLRLKTTSIQVPIHIYSTQYFRNYVVIEQGMYHFLIYGILISMIIYNLFLFFVIRDKLYLIYVVMMVMNIILTLISSGYYLYLLPYTHFFKTYNDTILVVSMVSQLFFGVALLDIKRNMPFFYKVFLVLIGINGLFLGLSMFSSILKYLVPSMFVNAFLGITLSFWLYLRGLKIVRYYLVAAIFTIGGFFINIFHIMGFLPTTAIIHQAPSLGVALEAIFFSFALADKINLMRKERYQAQKALLESTQKNEQLVTQQNEILAKKVEEKTEELRHANEMLIASNDYLQTSQEEIAAQRDDIQKKNVILEANHQKILQLNQFKQQMMGMIVHDLKNPLNSIIGLSEGNQNNTHIASINHSGKRMHHLVMNILDVQKMEDSQLSLNKETISLGSLMEIALPQIRFITQEKNQSIVVTHLPAVTLDVDINLLSRVMVNLLTNAAEYSHQNEEIRITAEVIDNSLKKGESCCKVSVVDQGVGIAPTFLDKVFDKFVQVKDSNTYRHNSTGLGLTFCKLVIEAHEGEVGVISELGKGSTFWFELPCQVTSKSVTIAPQTFQPEHQVLNTRFTSDEMAILRPIVAQVKTHEIFETGKIIKLLAGLENDPTPNLIAWKNSLENTLLMGNKVLFDQLLDI